MTLDRGTHAGYETLGFPSTERSCPPAQPFDVVSNPEVTHPRRLPRILDTRTLARTFHLMARRTRMRGTKYLFDTKGRKTAVVIDLRTNASLWEDVLDAAVARSRAREPRESLASVRRRREAYS